MGLHFVKILCCDACIHLQVQLESVRPDSGNEELRLKISALPLRLRIDQDIITFLQIFLAEDVDTLAAEPEPLEPQEALPQHQGELAQLHKSLHILRCHIAHFC